MQGEASRILKGVASGIPEDWARRPPEAEVSGFPTGWGNCFSLGGGLALLQKNGCCSTVLYPVPGFQQPFPHASPPSLPLQTLPTTADHAALP